MPASTNQQPDNQAEAHGESSPKLARRLGLFDATMIVMGGIIGAGIFINPSAVARQVHTPFLILSAWVLGGLIALAGAFIYAELAARRPFVGGQYAYLREAYHPAIAFMYGWTLLLVIQTGAMAAVAVTFAVYFLEVTRLPLPDWAVASLALAILTFINCLSVRAGSSVQNAFMVTKIIAVVALVATGLFFSNAPPLPFRPALDRPASLGLLLALGAAMTPVMFSYGGWQNASFIAGELREPRRDLARGFLIGVFGVIFLYLSVSWVYVQVLGADGLAATRIPASDVMRRALGPRGASLIAVGIAVSTFGFLSQGMLTAPRVYFAMAKDGLFFRNVAWVHPKTRVPVIAIALQGAFAIVIALTGKYEQILNYVVSVDFIWFGLTAICIFIFRRRAVNILSTSSSEDRRNSPDTSSATDATNELEEKNTISGFRVPGHPFTTIFFVAACWLVVFSTIYKYPQNSIIGLLIMLAGIPVFFLWRGRRDR
ncbi:MAG: amino acid permease [Pyrinomonadaceae bacterium]